MGDIKTRFALEGEAQFRSAMSNAASAVKMLNAEQKLAKAQFEQTGNAEKYAAQQADILKRKIQEQKAAVQAAEQAVKQLTDNGVSPASREFQKWQTKLNNAKAALTNTETELQTLNGTMQQTTTTAEGAGTAIESIGKKVSLDAVIGGIDSLTDKLAAAAKKAAELAIALIKGMRDSASWADELATTALVNDTTAEEVQRMRYTADILDTSYESIMKSRQKMANAMLEQEDLFKNLGVEIREASRGGKYGSVEGELRNWEDVFWDLGDALVRIQDVKGFEYVNKQASQLFGRNWEQLRPIFASDWASPDNYLARTFPELYGNYSFESAREYYDAVMSSWNVVSDENVNKLTRLDDAVQRLQNELTTTKETLASSLAPAFESVTQTISNLLSEFNEYLQTDEGKEKLDALSEAFSRMVESLANIDVSSVMEKAASAINGLTNGLEWIKNNWSNVETGLIALGAAFAGLKVSSGVLKFAQTLASLKYLFGGGKAAGSAATAATGAASAAGGATIGSIVAGVGKTLPWALPLALGAGGIISDQQMLAEMAERGAQSIAEYNTKSQLYGNSEYFDMWDTLMKYTTVNGESGSDAEGIQKFAQHYSEWFNDQVTDPLMDAMVDTMTDEQYDNFHDIMGRILSGDMFYSEEDRASLAKAMTDAISAIETLMQSDPAVIPVDFSLADGALAGLTAAIGTIHVPVTLDYSEDGAPHANGLWSVPFDGYPAILHKGERVMTAREVESRSYNSNLYVESMYMNSGTDAAGLASAMAAAQRRSMAGFGS